VRCEEGVRCNSRVIANVLLHVLQFARRLLTHTDFRDVLLHLKDEQVKWRALFPTKTRLLRLPFHRAINYSKHGSLTGASVSYVWSCLMYFVQV
jgi:hypothetical protein